MSQVSLPFFVLHGEADTVTDPEVSKALYEQAGSTDKTIKLYQGMWHGLTSGEPDSNVEIVFSDIISWLDKRAGVDQAQATTTTIHHDQYNFTAAADVQQSAPPIIEKLAAASASASSPKKLESQTASFKKRSQGNYFCGLKGRRMHHHSSM